ncbi:MAG: hypothetical protein HPY52_09885 [Firmicutes bacterium]|nr:hypothetical protein [Bacillota bacterium]
MGKVNPVEELLLEGEFTDRLEILRELEEWYRNIKNLVSGSLALISPRRMGKTALLDRLVNKVFFEDYGVAPFYFKMKREETTLHKFLLEYYTTFFRQYIAYLLRDPVLYGSRRMSLKDLLALETTDTRVRFIQEDFIKRFLTRYTEAGWQDARNHWEDMLFAPEELGVRLGIHVAVIIDEFQDMKFYVYDIADPEDIKPGKSFATDLTATYDRAAQSRRAPMLVTGSAVTMIFRTVMGGPLGGRFDFRYLKPMALVDGATLLKVLLHLYAGDAPTTDEAALYLSMQTAGHPYYIYCCVTSTCPGRRFLTLDDIDRVVEYEVTRGKIFGFWETHFAENQALLNQDNDVELGKKIIYYFTKYTDAPVDIEAIAAKLKVPPAMVEEKIEKLYLADLVYRSDFRYYTFNDPLLMRYIRHRYEHELKGLDKVELEWRGAFNYLKGKLLEQVVQNLLSHANNEELPGELFGRQGKVILPRFHMTGDYKVKLPDSREFQIDGFGEYTTPEGTFVWAAECKYRKDKPMTRPEVARVLEAAAVLKSERGAEKVQIWLVSTAGFTADAVALCREHDCYFSGLEEINALIHDYGIDVKIIPVEEEGA